MLQEEPREMPELAAYFSLRFHVSAIMSVCIPVCRGEKLRSLVLLHCFIFLKRSPSLNLELADSARVAGGPPPQHRDYRHALPDAAFM